MANPTLLEMPIARDGAKNSIPSTTSPTTGLLSQQYGWQDINSMPVQQGGKAPTRKDFNGVLNLLSNILFYCQKGWQFEWDSSQAYYAGCIVKDTSDGKMYQCLNDITSTTAPHSDTTNWKLWDLSMLANYLPLTGGTMTGEIIDKSNSYPYYLKIMGGPAGKKNGYLQAEGYGADDTDNNSGRVVLYAESELDTDRSYLMLKRDGRLRLTTPQFTDGDLAGATIVSASLTANGYIKTSKGLIFQWGTTLADGNTHSFPIAFTTDRWLTFNNRQTGTGEWTFYDTTPSADYNTKLSCIAYNRGGTLNSVNAIWFAIGY